MRSETVVGAQRFEFANDMPVHEVLRDARETAPHQQ